MVNPARLKVGDKVHYQPKPESKWENGLVKEIPEHSTNEVRVVYHCGGDWKNFKNYTSALTNARDLHTGWKHDEEPQTGVLWQLT